MYVCVCVSRPLLSDSLQPYGAHQAPLSMGFSRQEYWRGLPRPPPGDLSDPGMHPLLPVSLLLQADSLPTGQPGKLGLIKEVIKITLPYFYLLVMWQGETFNSTHGVALSFYTECCLEF